ncbi:MAG: hypothetical protein GXO00_01705, partial [Candidatus Diapherotrites archaeon]|nr:hypothetical protein [Candidatus Diapherotrites archaeon]
GLHNEVPFYFFGRITHRGFMEEENIEELAQKPLKVLIDYEEGKKPLLHTEKLVIPLDENLFIVYGMIEEFLDHLKEVGRLLGVRKLWAAVEHSQELAPTTGGSVTPSSLTTPILELKLKGAQKTAKYGAYKVYMEVNEHKEEHEELAEIVANLLRLISSASNLKERDFKVLLQRYVDELKEFKQELEMRK